MGKQKYINYRFLDLDAYVVLNTHAKAYLILSIFLNHLYHTQNIHIRIFGMCLWLLCFLRFL